MALVRNVICRHSTRIYKPTSYTIPYGLPHFVYRVDVRYHTADNLAVLPDNPLDAVEKLAAVLQYDLEQYVRVTPVPAEEELTLAPTGDQDQSTASSEQDFKHPFPSPCSIRHILTSYVDIMVSCSNIDMDTTICCYD